MQNIPIVPAQAGQVLDLGSGAQLEVLAVGKRGAVLLLEWKSFRLLLPIGLDFDSLEALQEDHRLVPVTALLLADSGYAPLNPPEWIQRWQPQVVLLSVAAGDKLGSPDSGNPAGSGWIHPAAHRPERLDRAEHRWRADVGGGGEAVNL